MNLWITEFMGLILSHSGVYKNKSKQWHTTSYLLSQEILVWPLSKRGHWAKTGVLVKFFT